MSVEKTIRGLKPLGGKVVPIRTVQETRPQEEFADAFVAEVNVKSASKVIKALDAAFPRDASLPLSHLRRFAKRESLPPPLKAAIENRSVPLASPVQTIFVLISPPLPDFTTLQALLAPFAPATAPAATNDPPTTNEIPDGALHSDPPPPSTIQLHPIKIPLAPPFNTTQAETWTKTLWPIIFNPAAPRSTVAPPPQTLKRAQESIEPRAGYYLSLARKVAEEAEQSGLGRGVGAVIVDPAIEEEITEAGYEEWDEAVLAVAGDARYSRSEAGAPSQAQLHAGVAPNPATKTYNADIEGGPELHALMRGVELISRWRREQERLDDVSASTATADPSTPELRQPELSAFESYFLYRRRPGTSTSISNSPPLPSSPLKRKHEVPNPESDLAIDPSTDPSQYQLHNPPLPAPPPSTVVLADSSTPVTTPAAPRIRTRSQGGYLCTDLDVYLSHEPCLCCSMGMLLSRFRSVIFPRRGRLETGGLSSEPVVGPVADQPDHAAKSDASADNGQNERGYYGLHWRKELNWRALGFEFVEDGDGDAEVKSEAEKLVFHA
ncbi:TRNA-specific adenosine-34 deaminase subunit Tad3, putative [Penicillium digitatum]|uniref:tRNA-specific adenosine-34 deaminase subunit Tad3, putative n=3 Tax=Penicillium digitatum TaxID=36651 RepID=K9GDY4_PEND2|nr:TRNA-specific adenosine-34 deaminase subunit Tad3, putative [Penicillium digitatum Pd1]EKV13003.1 TRNA-specific adenosine-34 deaminase subunit Tad3, putative [Penicillium digitatum PHI26]EKV18797.1 TRNA-specific adenosine-34 deaminase subunit Tad3, putative [Penicillium digitatum Pd1]QQK42808.1 TRNA-specific adenosine-34 deaminase subunit Tad3, putative [Penicillium digitatum]